MRQQNLAWCLYSVSLDTQMLRAAIPVAAHNHISIPLPHPTSHLTKHFTLIFILLCRNKNGVDMKSSAQDHGILLKAEHLCDLRWLGTAIRQNDRSLLFQSI